MLYMIMTIHHFIMKVLIFITNERHIVVVDLDKIILDNGNYFDEDNPDTIIHERLLA